MRAVTPLTRPSFEAPVLLPLLPYPSRRAVALPGALLPPPTRFQFLIGLISHLLLPELASAVLRRQESTNSFQIGKSISI